MPPAARARRGALTGRAGNSVYSPEGNIGKRFANAPPDASRKADETLAITVSDGILARGSYTSRRSERVTAR
jgi:hypothetical protein